MRTAAPPWYAAPLPVGVPPVPCPAREAQAALLSRRGARAPAMIPARAAPEAEVAWTARRRDLLRPGAGDARHRLLPLREARHRARPGVAAAERTAAPRRRGARTRRG